MGFDLDALTMSGAIEHIAREVRDGRGGWVLTPNLDILRQIATSPESRALAEQATLRLADGTPLVWAGRLQKTPLPERVAGSDLTPLLCERAAHEEWPVFLLGGSTGAAEKAAAALTARAPRLRIAGTLCPPLGFERDESFLRHIETTLCQASPTLVFVALGAFKQEKLIARLRPLMPRAWFLGIGITFSFIGGDIARAPRWARVAGLEWVHRLMQEPRRLAVRYLIHGIPFAVRVLAASAWKGLHVQRSAQARVD